MIIGELAALQPTKRFSNRVENYMRYRPSYPDDIVPFLETNLLLQKEQRIVDIGSGTGLFAEILLKKGYGVTCIEPNEEMRKAGEKKLSHYPGFISRQHKAEQTGLRNHTVDLITVAQAFHWMDAVTIRKEFARILKPGGHVVLAYNLRLTNSPFLQEYDQLKKQFAIEKNINDRRSEENIKSFFHPHAMNIQSFPNIQWLDFDALKGQLLSASYIPLPGHTSYDTMISSLVQLFVAHNKNGFVKMEYETKLYWGGL
ncbi:MAG: class I SAM-dependent methyltransferase [Bacteroidota bacterium]